MVINVNAATGRISEDLLSQDYVSCGRVFGSLFATNDGDYLAVYDLQTGQNVLGDATHYGTSLNSGFALSPDNTTLAAGGSQAVVFVKVPRDAAARAPRSSQVRWKPQESRANAISWLDERQFVTVQENGQVLWWDVDQPLEQATLQTRADSLSCATTVPGGDFLIVGGSRNDRGWLEVFDRARKTKGEHVIEHTHIVSLASGPDNAVAWGTDQGQLTYGTGSNARFAGASRFPNARCGI
jgi:hypothetical protein